MLGVHCSCTSCFICFSGLWQKKIRFLIAAFSLCECLGQTFLVFSGAIKWEHWTEMSWCTAQKMKFYIKDFFSKCDQIRSFLRICSHLLKKSLTESFILCAVSVRKSNFPSSLKIANIIAVCILKSWHIFMSDVFFVKYTIFCLNSCQDSISAIVTIHSIAC